MKNICVILLISLVVASCGSKDEMTILDTHNFGNPIPNPNGGPNPVGPGPDSDNPSPNPTLKKIEAFFTASKSLEIQNNDLDIESLRPFLDLNLIKTKKSETTFCSFLQERMPEYMEENGFELEGTWMRSRKLESKVAKEKKIRRYYVNKSFLKYLEQYLYDEAYFDHIKVLSHAEIDQLVLNPLKEDSKIHDVITLKEKSFEIYYMPESYPHLKSLVENDEIKSRKRVLYSLFKSCYCEAPSNSKVCRIQ